MGIRKLLLVAALLAVSPSLQAAQRYVLRLGDAEFRGSSAIAIKALLQRQHGLQVRFLELREVSVVAKSEMGRGTAALRVGGAISNPQRIHGSPFEFRIPRPRTFDRLAFHSPSRRSVGVPWQLIVNGRVKVRKIVVTVDHVRGGRDDGRFDDRWNGEDEEHGRGDRDGRRRVIPRP